MVQSVMKRAVKTAVGLAAPWMSPLQAELDRCLTVFVYHDVSDAPSPFSQECDLAVGVRQFERQIRFVAETFHVISMDDLLANRVPKRAALITFDDGLAGIFREALPLLRRFRLPSTIFLNMAPVLGEPFWAARAVYLCRHMEGFLAFLTERTASRMPGNPHVACTPELVEAWERLHGDSYLKTLSDYTGVFATPDDLQDADQDSLVTFGNHLYHHYNMLNLSAAQVHAEFKTNAEALSSYGGSRPVLTVPFGRGFTDQHVAWLLGWGVARLFTGISSLNRDPHASILHRVTLTNWHDRPAKAWSQLAMASVARSVQNGHNRQGWSQT